MSILYALFLYAYVNSSKGVGMIMPEYNKVFFIINSIRRYFAEIHN
jgi:hypothetical protein